jgi:WXG100 family type VII secretion target
MSNDEHIRVTFAALAQAAADVEHVAAQMDQHHTHLRGVVDPLVSSWTGEAGSSYETIQQQWDAGGEDLNDLLKRIARTLRVAADRYRSAERAIAALWP